MARKRPSEEAGTKATKPNKQTAAVNNKPGKTRAQKDAHNLRCQQSRAKIRERCYQHEQMANEYLKIKPQFEQLRAEYERMNMELSQAQSRMQRMSNDMQDLRRKYHELQAAYEAQMRQFEIGLIHTNLQIGQVSGTTATVFQDANELPGLVGTGTDSFHPSMVDSNQQFGLGSNYTNITAPAAAAPSSFVNEGFPVVFDDPGGPMNYAAGFFLGANDLPAFGAPNNSLFTRDLAAGELLREPAVGSSSGANHNLPNELNATNIHYNSPDLFTHGLAPGSLFEENSSLKPE